MIRISVVIPTYNRLEALSQCLAALSVQKNVQDAWEIVLVNDGGFSIENVVRQYDKSAVISHITQVNSGPASARNIGVEMAKGEIIAFLDDDCIPDENWVSTILLSLKKGRILGGKVINQFGSNLYSETSQLLIDFLYKYNFGTKDEFFTSNNFALYKSDFTEIGGFSTDFNTSAGEDREFCVRAKSVGLNLNLNERMKIKHAHYLDFNSFFKLHKKYGYAAYEYHLAMIRQNVEITTNPRIIFYLRLFQYPFKQTNYSIYQKIKIEILLMLSQFAVALGYFQHRLKSKQVLTESLICFL